MSTQYYTIVNRVGRDLLLTANEADGNLVIRTAITGHHGISDSQLWRKELAVDGYYLVSKNGVVRFGHYIGDQAFVSPFRGSELVFLPDQDDIFYHIQDFDTKLVLAVPNAGEGAKVIGYRRINTPDQMWIFTKVK